MVEATIEATSIMEEATTIMEEAITIMVQATDTTQVMAKEKIMGMDLHSFLKKNQFLLLNSTKLQNNQLKTTL